MMLTTRQVADALGTDQRHVRRMLANRAMPGFRFSRQGRWDIDAGELSRWLAAGRPAN